MTHPISTSQDDYSPASLSAVARQLFTSGPFLKRKLQHWRPYICPFGEILRHVPHSARVLDIGCGGGLLLGLLARLRNVTGVGFDMSPIAIQVATQMTSRQPDLCDRIHFHVQRAQDDWPAFNANLVTLIDVMHHVPPDAVASVLAKAFARVPAAGRLIYKDMASRPLWRATHNRLHDLIIARQWIHYVDSSQVVRLAEQAGLHCVHAATIGCGPYGHELRVFDRAAMSGA